MQERYDVDKEGMKGWAMVAQYFNPSTQRGRGLCEFEASLVYRVNSRKPEIYRETLSPKTKK